MACQLLGSHLADIAYAEGKEHAVEGHLLRLLDGCQYVVGTLLLYAGASLAAVVKRLQSNKLLACKSVEVCNV